VWRTDTLIVDGQEPALPTNPRTEPTATRFRVPPCAAPPGGWPHGAEDENLDLHDFPHDDEALVAVSLFRPSARQVVVVIATTEPDRLERELRPRFGQRLCIVASPWTTAQVDAVTDALRTNMGAWRLYRTGPVVTAAGQAQASADAVLVTEQFAAWAAEIPDDLLEVNAWLTPGGLEN
jgi:hypothetical protein